MGLRIIKGMELKNIEKHLKNTVPVNCTVNLLRVYLKEVNTLCSGKCEECILKDKCIQDNVIRINLSKVENKWSDYDE